ncbi:putative RNA methyltransferase [Candidatus Leptofilum sp.]|uniref:putative RNA methyltransferase n=1 Tax=Candidatus Leptofilum sp. TaxID=3241576 RepID=UPI003B5BC0F8
MGFKDERLIYCCPVCQDGFGVYGRSLKCTNNHSYDIAKEGYVNLLLANQKRSLQPGDNQTMVRHRRQFFDTGLYEPLSDKINEMVADLANQSGPNKRLDLLDSGCGEGYFLHRLGAFFVEGKRPSSLHGIDISKFAIKAAAKRDKLVNWAVASSYDLPILPDSMDVVLNVMAPFDPAEFGRVLKGNGRVLRVTPGPEHLFSLRQHIYPNPEKHPLPSNELAGFTFCDSQRVQFVRHLQNEQIQSLFVMTPYSWNASAETREKIMSLPELNITVDFVLTLFQKASSSNLPL